MHEKSKCVCFNSMQPQKVKLKSVQINMKHVSYILLCILIKPAKIFSCFTSNSFILIFRYILGNAFTGIDFIFGHCHI